MIEDVFRAEWGRVLAALVGLLGDVDLAEESLQEAFAVAAERWPRTGMPDKPAAWLLTTARNAAIDRLRRARTLAAKTYLLEPRAAVEELVEDVQEAAVPDERLELIFMCCHPALATDAQVALTLRALGGLSTEAIARAFLVPAETMKRRLSRAKAKIKTAGIPFRRPAPHLLQERLAAVLAVVYLIFNEGYGGRADLADEAVRLGRILARLLPQEPEPQGLLALLLCHNARRRARFAQGKLVLLHEQDRSLWTLAEIAEGRRVLESGACPGRTGALCAPGGDRVAADRGPRGLAAGRRPVRAARRVDPLPGGGAQPRRGRGPGRVTARGPRYRRCTPSRGVYVPARNARRATQSPGPDRGGESCVPASA